MKRPFGAEKSDGPRKVDRCPECGLTTWARRVGGGFRGEDTPDTRYRCECGARFNELAEGETDASGKASVGLARRLEELAEEHDGDVPIRPEGSA